MDGDTRSAKHIVDTSTSQVAHAAVFSWARNDLVRKLEFGIELQFFLEQKAKETNGGEINGVKVQQYDLDIESTHLTLMIDLKKQTPLRVQMKDANGEFTIDYLSFDKHVKFDPSVFTVPNGISVENAESDESKSTDRKDLKNAWLGDFMSRYYEHPNPSRITDSLTAIKEDHMLKNFFSLSGFYAPIMRQNPEMISSWIQAAKDLGSDMREFIYFSLRQCGSEKCLSELRQNPFGYDEQGMKTFAEFKSPTVETIPLTSPDSLDFLWADFLATGSDVGPRRIARLVGAKWPLFESKNLHGGELMVVGAAHWSLVSNAEQHQKVLRVLKEESAHTPALKKVLGEVRSPVK